VFPLVNPPASATILVVEDDPMNAKFLEITLTRRAHYGVICSQDPEEIIRLVRDRRVDLVLMDISLANSSYRGVEVDGLMLTRILKVTPETSACPVILATAHAMRGSGEAFVQETHADGYVPKPITRPQDLLDKIAALLAVRAPGRDQAAPEGKGT
jgi:CheY-like chemotaxis protein